MIKRELKEPVAKFDIIPIIVMMMVIMIMSMIFQAVTTIMLLFLEQVPQVNNGLRFYLPGLLEMNTHLKRLLSKCEE